MQQLNQKIQEIKFNEAIINELTLQLVTIKFDIPNTHNTAVPTED